MTSETLQSPLASCGHPQGVPPPAGRCTGGRGALTRRAPPRFSWHHAIRSSRTGRTSQCALPGSDGRHSRAANRATAGITDLGANTARRVPPPGPPPDRRCQSRGIAIGPSARRRRHWSDCRVAARCMESARWKRRPPSVRSPGHGLRSRHPWHPVPTSGASARIRVRVRWHQRQMLGRRDRDPRGTGHQCAPDVFRLDA